MTQAWTVVLVEGTSDQHALEALARRLGRDLDTEGVAVVRMGGAQAIGGCLERDGPRGLDLRLAGLCDAGEERYVRRALERGGLGAELTRSDMEELGFDVCDVDLEDELTQSTRAGRRGAGHRGRGRDLRVPHLPEAAREARSDARGAAAGVHVEPEDPIRHAARRGARPHPRSTAARPPPGRRLRRGELATGHRAGGHTPVPSAQADGKLLEEVERVLSPSSIPEATIMSRTSRLGHVTRIVSVVRPFASPSVIVSTTSSPGPARAPL